MKSRRFFLALLCAGILHLFGLYAQAQVQSPLRVCADPDYLPFSNKAGEGFENKIAEAVAKSLGVPLEYTWASYRKGSFVQFLANNLEAKKCDVIMSLPYGSREALSTQPYYVSSYVFVFKKSKNYDIKSMSSPVLKTLKLGFEAETPVEDGLKMRGLVPGMGNVPYEIGADSDASPSILLDALDKGDIDVLITWEPAISQFLMKRSDLEVMTVPNERTMGAPEQYAFPMSMGVRQGDEATQKRMNEVIAKEQVNLTAILESQGVRLYTAQQ
jgi:mxaJ protein